MKCKKVISELAAQDIKENAIWFNSKRKNLGKEFLFEIRKTVNFILDFPSAFPIKYDEIRVAQVDIFQYSVHYYFDEPKNTVFISCIFHNSNNPEIPPSR